MARDQARARDLESEAAALEPFGAAGGAGAGEGLDGDLQGGEADLDRHAVVHHHADMVLAEQEVAAAERRGLRHRHAERALVARVARAVDAAELERELDEARAVDAL